MRRPADVRLNMTPLGTTSLEGQATDFLDSIFSISHMKASLLYSVHCVTASNF